MTETKRAATMTPQSSVDNDLSANDLIAARRASARRTALIAAGIAVSVYLGFIVLNWVSQ